MKAVAKSLASAVPDTLPKTLTAKAKSDVSIFIHPTMNRRVTAKRNYYWLQTNNLSNNKKHTRLSPYYLLALHKG